MIKFKCKGNDGAELAGFGLSARNLELLMDGKPIFIKGAEVGIATDVVIFYGKTEKDMQEQLKSFITKDTVVHGDSP
jgi:hypothetical protein